MINILNFVFPNNNLISFENSIVTFILGKKKEKPQENPKEVNSNSLKLENSSRVCKDYKTVLSQYDAHIISEYKENVNAYFFICKESRSSAWHWVLPVTQGINSQKILQFNVGGFALQGCGGGLSATKTVMYKLKDLELQGYSVNYIPRVIDNDTLYSFEYVCETNLQKLIDVSLDLILYRKDEFEEIYDQFNQILLSDY